MLRDMKRMRGAIVGAALAVAAPLAAQESPLANFVVAGYGSANYGSFFTGENLDHDFSAAVSPVLLYSMGDDLLFEAELEFGLSGENTTTALEYAQVDYLGFENVIITAGKFLLPFGLFGERLHPSWVNKMPNAPLLYGHAHGGVAEDAMLPILSDAGVMVRFAATLSESWGLDLSVFGTQGPRQLSPDEAGELGGHVHDIDPFAARSASPDHDDAAALAAEIPTIAFGTSFNDNNENKLIGARLGLVNGPRFEIYVSGFHAMYDEDNFLDLFGGNVSMDFRSGAWDFRGEANLVRQEFPHDDVYETVSKPGYYVQAARRFGNIEPVLRWSHLLDGEVDGLAVLPERKRMAAGIDFWVDPSIPLKIMYEWDSLDHDHVLVQWAFGF